MSDAKDLSGGWDGIFNYADGHPPNVFAAILRDIGGVLTGETTEPSDDDGDHAETLHAWIEGQHEGAAVTFVKSYDDPARADYVVQYSGSATPDGTEISGTWDIVGIRSGTFIMVRKAGQAEEVDLKVAETVR